MATILKPKTFHTTRVFFESAMVKLTCQFFEIVSRFVYIFTCEITGKK